MEQTFSKTNSRLIRAIVGISITSVLVACASTGKSSHDYVRELSFEPTVRTERPIQIKTRTVNYRYIGPGGTRYAGTVPVHVPGQSYQNYGVLGSDLDVSYSFILQSSLQAHITTGEVRNIYYGKDFSDGVVSIELVFENVFTSFESGTRLEVSLTANAPGYSSLARRYNVGASGWIGCGACTSDDSAFKKLNNRIVKDIHDWL